MAWSVVYAISRVTTALLAVFLSSWKKLALWSYGGSVAIVFLVALWGDASIGSASIDLVGLAILIGLLRFVEPMAWSQFE